MVKLQRRRRVGGPVRRRRVGRRIVKKVSVSRVGKGLLNLGRKIRLGGRRRRRRRRN